MDEYTLKLILEECWGEDTALGDWNPNVPSTNQCAVTALVVQDIMGGELWRCPMTGGGSHYWNQTPKYGDADFTSEQFLYMDSQPVREEREIRSREYVLSYPNTMLRYAILLKRVAEKIIERSDNGVFILRR